MNDDVIDRYLERVAREEENDINRKQAALILAMFEEDKRRREQDPLVKLLHDAHRQTRQASEDGQQ